MSLLSDQLKNKEAWNKTYQQLQTAPELEGKPLVEAQPSAPAAPPKAQSGTFYDIVREYGSPYDYAAEKQEAERQRKLGLFTDFINSATNIGSALAGRRLYGQPVSATKMATDKMQRIRDIQRNSQQSYQNALLNARVKDADAARRDRLNEGQLALQRAKLDQDARKYAQSQAYTANKNAKDYQIRLAKLAQDAQIARDRNKHDAEQGYANRLSRENIARIRSASSGSDNKIVEFVGRDGRKLSLPKRAAAAWAAYVYGKMKEIVDKEGRGRTLDDVALKTGEGGTQEDKTIQVVRERLRDFPELQSEIDALEQLNQMYPNASESQWNQIINGKQPEVWDPSWEGQAEDEYVPYVPKSKQK